MIKTRYQTRQLLLTLLIILVSVILGLSLYYAIDDHIKLINTWQYNATYDFEKEIETTQDGKNTLVCNINNAEQLAGAFAFELQGPPEVSGGGSGSSDGSIDYNLISQFVDSTLIRLTSSIDLTGKIWKPNELRTGVTFDGNGFCIKNLKVNNSGDNLGFISINNGTIKNLVFVKANITNTDMTQKSTSNGVVAGINNGIVENVTVVSGSVYANADGDQNNDRRAGGIVGLNNSENSIVRYCTNYATVSRSKFSGGIVGFQGNGLIEYCYNYGAVSCRAKIYPRMGGICAEVVNGTVQYCYNEGDILDNESQATGDLRAGGILGMQFESVTVQYCGNIGEIDVGNSNASATYAGGIVGYSDGNILNCFNRAHITAASKENYTSVEGNNTTYDSISVHSESKSEYLGTVKRSQSLYYSRSKTLYNYWYRESFAGGIAGKALTISNSYSIGNIIGGYKYFQIIANDGIKGYYYVRTPIILANQKANINGKVNNANPLFVVHGLWLLRPSANINEGYLSYAYSFEGYNEIYSHNICPSIEAPKCLYTGSGSNIAHNNGSVTLNWKYYKKKVGDTTEPSDPTNLKSKTLIVNQQINKDSFSELSDKYLTVTSAKWNVNFDNNKFTFSVSLADCKGESDNFNNVNNNSIIAQIDYKIPTYSSSTIANIKSESSLETLGEGWSINPNKNDGYPYIEGLYW